MSELFLEYVRETPCWLPGSPAVDLRSRPPCIRPSNTDALDQLLADFAAAGARVKCARHLNSGVPTTSSSAVAYEQVDARRRGIRCDYEKPSSAHWIPTVCASGTRLRGTRFA